MTQHIPRSSFLSHVAGQSQTAGQYAIAKTRTELRAPRLSELLTHEDRRSDVLTGTVEAVISKTTEAADAV